MSKQYICCNKWVSIKNNKTSILPNNKTLFFININDPEMPVWTLNTGWYDVIEGKAGDATHFIALDELCIPNYRKCYDADISKEIGVFFIGLFFLGIIGMGAYFFFSSYFYTNVISSGGDKITQVVEAFRK